MVGDDRLDALSRGVGDLRPRVDPIVHRHEQRDALLGQRLDRLDVQPVPLVDAVRQVRHDLQPEALQGRYDDCRAGDPVGVEVAEHADGVAPQHRRSEPRRGLVHVGQQERVVGEIASGIEECRRLVRGPDAAVVQQMRVEGRKADRVGIPAGRRRKQFPDLIEHGGRLF